MCTPDVPQSARRPSNPNSIFHRTFSTIGNPDDPLETRRATLTLLEGEAPTGTRFDRRVFDGSREDAQSAADKRFGNSRPQRQAPARNSQPAQSKSSPGVTSRSNAQRRELRIRRRQRTAADATSRRAIARRPAAKGVGAQSSGAGVGLTT